MKNKEGKFIDIYDLAIFAGYIHEVLCKLSTTQYKDVISSNVTRDDMNTTMNTLLAIETGIKTEVIKLL